MFVCFRALPTAFKFTLAPVYAKYISSKEEGYIIRLCILPRPTTLSVCPLMNRCFLFASLLSPTSNTDKTTYAASSTGVNFNSTFKHRRLTASDMAQVRVGKRLPLLARRPSLRQANMPLDWQTYAQVEAGRPFYPLFKDEVIIDPSLLEPTHQPLSTTAELISPYSTPPPTTVTSKPHSAPHRAALPTLQTCLSSKATLPIPSS